MGGSSSKVRLGGQPQVLHNPDYDQMVIAQVLDLHSTTPKPDSPDTAAGLSVSDLVSGVFVCLPRALLMLSSLRPSTSIDLRFLRISFAESDPELDRALKDLLQSFRAPLSKQSSSRECNCVLLLN